MGGYNEVSSCNTEKGSDEEGDADGQRIAETFSQYQVRSIQATVTVRQLRSEGLSFQLWPAANALCLYIENEFGERGMSGIDARPPHLQLDVACWYSSYAVQERNPALDDKMCHVIDSSVGDSLERNGSQRTDSNDRRAASVVQVIEKPFASIDIAGRMDPVCTNLVLDDNICSVIDSTVGLCNNFDRNERIRTDSKDEPDAQISLERPFDSRQIGNPRYANFEASNEQKKHYIERNGAHVVNEFEAPLSLGTDISNVHFPIRRMRVLELGSGTGMVGIVAACLGADVVLTDLPHVIPNISYNLDLNRSAVAAAGGSVEARVLRWGVEEDMKALGEKTFDLILASDCVYHDASYKPFLQTLNWLMALDTEHTNVTTERQKPTIPKGVGSTLRTPLHGTELLPSELLEPAVCLSPLSKKLMPVVDEIDPEVNKTLEQRASQIETGRLSVSNMPELGFDTKDRGERRCVILLGHVRRWKKDSHFFRMAAKCFDVDVVYQHPPEENDRIGPIIYRLSTKSNRKTSSIRSRSSSASITSL